MLRHFNRYQFCSRTRAFFSALPELLPALNTFPTFNCTFLVINNPASSISATSLACRFPCGALSNNL